MADILIHSTVPSLHTQTESASNLIIDTQTKDSQPINKYNGHVTQLRNLFTEQSLTSDDHSTKSMTNNRREHIHKQFTDTPFNRSYNEDVNSYAIVNRKYSNSEQHYNIPADAIEQLKKQQQQRDDHETHIIPLLLPSTVVKRMNHLNTTFVKPTKIERSLPKLVFQDNDEKQKQSKSLNGNDIF
jgi:hypothetical protein